MSRTLQLETAMTCATWLSPEPSGAEEERGTGGCVWMYVSYVSYAKSDVFFPPIFRSQDLD